MLTMLLMPVFRRIPRAFRRTVLRKLFPFMIGKGNTFSADLLKLIFQATAISLLADNTATTPLTVLYVSLHTSDPGASGNQTTNETSYTSYTRISVARTSGGWSISSQTISPVANISFPACTGSTATITHFAVGTVTTGGTGKILYSGTVTPNISVSNGVTPLLTTASTITEA